MCKDEVFLKFELDRLDLFHLSAILSAVAFNQKRIKLLYSEISFNERRSYKNSRRFIQVIHNPNIL